MIVEKGWWKLTITGVDHMNETDRHYIAEWIRQGFNEGEIIHEKEENEDK